MNEVACPHCSAANPPGSSFCSVCGKAIASARPLGPRVVEDRAFAATATGQALQGDALAREARKAYGALLAVGILQAVFGAIVLAMIQWGSTTPLTGDVDLSQASIGVLAVTMFGIAATFLGLAFWARRNPLPAAIVGLVLFLTVHLLDALADPMALARGIFLKIIIVVVLAKAISAGARHRALLRASATPAIR